MVKILALGNSSRNISGKRNKTVGREIVIGPNSIRFIAILICAVLSLVYLTQSTSGANRSVQIGDLETKRGQLLLEEKRLEEEQTRLRSLKNIDSGIQQPVMEPASEVGNTGTVAGAAQR